MFKFQVREIVTAMADKKNNENISKEATEVSLKTDSQSPSNYQQPQFSHDKNLQQNRLTLWVIFKSFLQITK